MRPKCAIMGVVPEPDRRGRPQGETNVAEVDGQGRGLYRSGRIPQANTDRNRARLRVADRRETSGWPARLVESPARRPLSRTPLSVRPLRKY